MKDIFGKALLDYYHNFYIKNSTEKAEPILTWTNISDKDLLPLSYLFRSYNKMPKVEKKALQLCRGKVLDVGCGAGSHSLYLQDKGFDVEGIDISEGAIKVAQLRGAKNVYHENLLNISKKYDTLLLLMNGTGIFQSIENTHIYLNKLKDSLNKNGQILIDSTDILYMYKDEHGYLEEDLPETYYGELDYFYSYKGEEEYGMKWLYLDFKTLKKLSKANGLKCELIYKGKNEEYLAKLTEG